MALALTAGHSQAALDESLTAPARDLSVLANSGDSVLLPMRRENASLFVLKGK